MASQPLTNMDAPDTTIRKRRGRPRAVSSRTGAAGGVGTPMPTRGSRSFNSDPLTGIVVGYAIASNTNPQQALYAVQHDLAKFGWNT
jgi:hypothetical protein